MKLYEVPRNSKIKIDGQEFLFYHVDGMYSYCTTIPDNQAVHLAAWTEVDVVEA